MKPIETAKRGQLGRGRTPATRPCGSGVPLAGTDPDFGPGAAAPDRIETPTR